MHDSSAQALYLQMRSRVGEMRFRGLFLMVLGLVVSSLRYR